jgi:ATP-dependent helicase YprA (DUF1998 family)
VKITYATATVCLPLTLVVLYLLAMEGLGPGNSSRPSGSGSGIARELTRRYNSLEGHNLCKKILAKYLPYDPHDYQLDGICPVMDGYDLLAATPTGSGKTGYLIMLMLVVREISEDQTLALNERKFPKDPAMIVVCPTKALEEDMVCTEIQPTTMIS